MAIVAGDDLLRVLQRLDDDLVGVGLGSDTVLQNAATATGNGTVANVAGAAALMVQVQGIGSATITWEANIDGTNWVAVPLANVATGLVATSATGDGLYARRVAGLKQVRARISSYLSGTITVTAHGLPNGTAGQMPVLLLGQANNPGDTALRMGSPVDAGAAMAALLGVLNYPTLFNGSTFDRVYNNQELTVLSSGARTVLTNSADFVNFNGRGVIFFLNVSAASGTGGLTLRLQAKDPISGNYVSVNTAPTAVIAVGLSTYAYYVGGAAGLYTKFEALPIPRTWRVQVTVGDATSYTYSVSAVVLN